MDDIVKVEDSPYSVPYRVRYRANKENREIPSRFRKFKDSLRSVCREYCTESSICGLKHIVDDKASYCERVSWTLTMIGALACSITLVYLTFRKYYMAPLITTQIAEGTSVRKIIFPAVGICTTNRISKEAVTELARKLLKEKRNEEYSESDILTMLRGLGQLYDYQPVDVSEDVAVRELHKVLGDYDVDELMKQLSPSCMSLLERCMWNGKFLNCSDLFDFRLTMNGYCCTFNYLRRSDYFEVNSSARNIDMYQYGNKSRFGDLQGLKVMLKFNSSDDFYYNVPLKGAQMQFSDAYDFPDDPSGSFAAQIISPSVEMKVLVAASVTEAARDIQHIAMNIRGCLFYDESDYLPFYTHSDCMLKCRMLFLRDKCNCSPFTMPKMVNVRRCNLRDVSCLRKYYARSIASRPDLEKVPPEMELELVGGGISCPMCYPACSKTVYTYAFSNVNYFPEHLNRIPNYEREEWMAGVNYSETSIISVRYASDTADCFGQNVIMKWFDLFSNIGSTCGLVSGFSFVSVLEFIYFLTFKLIREVWTQKINAEAAWVSSNMDDIAPRPIYWDEIRGNNNVRRDYFINID